MNQLKVSLQEAIVGLFERGWSQRRIARDLRVDRETVKRYISAAKPAISTTGSTSEATTEPAISTAGSATGTLVDPAISTTGSKAAKEVKPAIPTAGSPAGRVSLCREFLPQIIAALGAGLSAQRIHQDLVSDYGFAGSYESVKRCVRSLSAQMQLPVRRMESAPGEQMQVDFGQGAWVVDEAGKRRRPHLFRAVLSHSRKGYSEVVWRQDTETFIRCVEMHIAFACTGDQDMARTLLERAHLEAASLRKTAAIFCVATYSEVNRDEFITWNARMLQAIDRGELWDGMKLAG